MKTIDIKGKSYVMVHERIKHFRENYPDWKMISHIPEYVYPNLEDYCLVVTEIFDDKGQCVATGHAFERQSDGFINKTSHIENAETSSWGRALANLNIGIDESIASADEVANAVREQSEKPWLTHHEFDLAVKGMNSTADKEARQAQLNELIGKYRIKKTYRQQLEEMVQQRDMNL